MNHHHHQHYPHHIHLHQQQYSAAALSHPANSARELSRDSSMEQQQPSQQHQAPPPAYFSPTYGAGDANSSLRSGAAVPPLDLLPPPANGNPGINPNANLPNRQRVLTIQSLVSPTDTDDSHTEPADSVISMEDPDVRLAAEALGDLRADCLTSPPMAKLALPPAEEPAPLLTLLGSTHPMIQTAINGSLSAYTTSKTYSPKFRYGAEFLERNIGTPVASTVGSVGRRTGVDQGLRWVLERQRSQAADATSDSDSEMANKRRRVGDEAEVRTSAPYGNEMTPVFYHHRAQSQLSFAESLPAYDDARVPMYESLGDAKAGGPSSQTWQARLMISTSGLGAALSEESLKSLRYCLGALRWANGNLGRVVISLKDILDNWDRTKSDAQLEAASSSGESQSAGNSAESEPEGGIQKTVQGLKEDVLQTLKRVIDIVSTYAGGALPEHARDLVRRHLTSLPQRFKVASTGCPAPGEENGIDSARRFLVLAKEGLDMIAQVTRVVDDTVVSADDWCRSLGRKPASTADEKATGAPAQDEDHVMQDTAVEEKL